MSSPCGGCVLTLKEMPGLSGLEGGFEDFVPVFLSGKM